MSQPVPMYQMKLIMLITICLSLQMSATSPLDHDLNSTASIEPVSCPLYFWRDDEICNADTTYYRGNRCGCTNKPDPSCCLQNAEFVHGQTYDSDRVQKSDLICAQDSQLLYPRKDEIEQYGNPQMSPGYLLYEGVHHFEIGILPLNYSCDLGLEIYWELKLLSTNCSEDQPQDWQCDGENWESVGIHVSNLSGMVNIKNETDPDNSIVFNVKKLMCNDAMESLGFDGDVDCEWPNNVELHGELIFKRAVSKCDDECYDGRIYPLRIPVWYAWSKYNWATPPPYKPNNWWDGLCRKTRIMIVIFTVFISFIICVGVLDCYRRKRKAKMIQHVEFMVPVSTTEETVDVGESI